MVGNFLFYMFLGMAASFLGTIPVGPINVSVVATTVRKNFRAGLVFSNSAAFVEILQSLLALQFGVMLSELLFDNPAFKLVVAALFFLIGIAFILKRQKQIEEKAKRNLPTWLSGFTISLLNPQALPFWIFVFGFYQSSNLIDMQLLSWMQMSCMLSFLMGVYIGKFTALGLYSYLSNYLSSKISNFAYWINKILGFVFILLAISQLWSLLMS